MLGALLLLLLAASEAVAIADEATGETYCAEIVSDSSSTHLQQDDWHFTFTFKVHWWVPKMHISIAFGEPVEIAHTYGGASEVDYGQGAPSGLELHVPTWHTTALHCHPTHTPCACRLLQLTRIPSWSSWTKKPTRRIPSLW